MFWQSHADKEAGGEPMTESSLPKETRSDRANAISFSLRLFEINQSFNRASISLEEFKQAISEDAFAINAFIDYEMDTSDRKYAVDLALQTTEVYNRNFPQSAKGLTTDDLFVLARNILEFMRHGATPIS
jgi:hypothetical protein